MPSLYSAGDARRHSGTTEDNNSEPYRTPWRRDYARLVHSPSFRRLQGKTQVFPGHESDFYRNRLTHSLEVAQIAKSIAIRLNSTNKLFSSTKQKIEPDIVEFAGLAHDLGHPPFGHNGEEALDECMGDHGGFEGNAQTLRILSRLEKKKMLGKSSASDKLFRNGKDLRCGIDLTYRTLASLLKYDFCIPERRADRKNPSELMKGYYLDNAGLVEEIKAAVVGKGAPLAGFKTIECSIMDVADDIAYSTYDLEDNFKAGFLTPMGLFALEPEIYKSVAETIRNRVRKQYADLDLNTEAIDPDLVRHILFQVFETILFGGSTHINEILKSKRGHRSAKTMIVAKEVQLLSRKLASDGYERCRFTSNLVGTFISGIEVIPHQTYPQLHQARLNIQTFLFVEVLKNITFHAIIKSPGLQVVEYRGKDIVKSIFKAINDPGGIRLLPDDFRVLCQEASEMNRVRAICDFISGMTDRYAFEFYSRLFGTTNLTIHKPL